MAERLLANRLGVWVEILTLTVGSYVDTDSKTHGFLFTQNLHVDVDIREPIVEIQRP